MVHDPAQILFCFSIRGSINSTLSRATPYLALRVSVADVWTVEQVRVKLRLILLEHGHEQEWIIVNIWKISAHRLTHVIMCAYATVVCLKCAS